MTSTDDNFYYGCRNWSWETRCLEDFFTGRWGMRFGAYPIWQDTMDLRIAKESVPEFGIIKGRAYHCTELAYPVQSGGAVELPTTTTNLNGKTVLGRGMPKIDEPTTEDWERLSRERHWLKRGYQYGHVCRPLIPMAGWNGNDIDRDVFVVPFTIHNIQNNDCLNLYAQACSWPLPIYMSPVNGLLPGVPPTYMGHAAYGRGVTFASWCTCNQNPPGEPSDFGNSPFWALQVEILAGRFCSQDDQLCSADLLNSCLGIDLKFSGVFVRLTQLPDPFLFDCGGSTWEVPGSGDVPYCFEEYPCRDLVDGVTDFYDETADDRVGGIIQEEFVPVRDWFDPNSQYWLGSTAFNMEADFFARTNCLPGVGSGNEIIPLRGNIEFGVGEMRSQAIRVGAYPPQSPDGPDGEDPVDITVQGIDTNGAYVLPNAGAYDRLLTAWQTNDPDIPHLVQTECYSATYPYMAADKQVRHKLLPPLVEFSDCMFQPGIRCELKITDGFSEAPLFHGIGWNTHFFKTRRNSIVWFFGWWEEEFDHDRVAIDNLFPYTPRENESVPLGMWRIPLWVELFGDGAYQGFMGSDNDLPRCFLIGFPAAHWNNYHRWSHLIPFSPVGWVPSGEDSLLQPRYYSRAAEGVVCDPDSTETCFVGPAHPHHVGWRSLIAPTVDTVTRYPKRWADPTTTFSDTGVSPIPGISAMWDEAYDYHDGEYPGWTRHCQAREIGVSDEMDGKNRELFPMQKVWDFDTAQFPLSFATEYYQPTEKFDPWRVHSFWSLITVRFMR